MGLSSFWSATRDHSVGYGRQKLTSVGTSSGAGKTRVDGLVVASAGLVDVVRVTNRLVRNGRVEGQDQTKVERAFASNILPTVSLILNCS